MCNNLKSKQLVVSVNWVKNCTSQSDVVTGCAVAQHCVNGDRPSQWEMANFDPSQNRNP